MVTGEVFPRIIRIFLESKVSMWFPFWLDVSAITDPPIRSCEHRIRITMFSCGIRLLTMKAASQHGMSFSL
jgi:hypothetical protein